MKQKVLKARREDWVKKIVTMGGIGKIPYAPGTFGTFAAIPFVFLLSLVGNHFYLIGAGLGTVIAVILAQSYENLYHQTDPKEIVIDEVIGFIVAMALLPFNWKTLFLAFVIFRFFDALKPFPIFLVERKIKGGWGVVADDWVAGLMTNLILQIILHQTLWLE